MSADWKVKYLDIRAKLKEATDVAYRLGYERGMKDGTQAAAMQQMAQIQQAQAAMNGGQPGQPGQEGGGDPMQEGGGMPPQAGGMPPSGDSSQDEAMMDASAPEAMGDEQGGSELDQHINELQSLVSKGQKPSVLDLRKAVETLAEVRKSQKNAWAKKTEKVIPAQKKVVDNILKKWEEESKKSSEKIEDIIKEHGLKVE